VVRELKVGDIRVKVYGSSDIGVSYSLKIFGVKIYFAGDNVDWRREEFQRSLIKIY